MSRRFESTDTWARPEFIPPPVWERIRNRLPYVTRRRLIAVMLAAVVGVSVVGVMARAQQTLADFGTTTEIVVVAGPIPRGSVLAASDVTIERWPIGLVPDALLATSPVGRVALVDLVAGEVLVEQRLLPVDGAESDERVVTIPQPLAPPPLRIGQRVALYGIQPGETPFPPAATLIGDGVVVALDDDGISLAVPEERVPHVIEHMAFGSVEIAALP